MAIEEWGFKIICSPFTTQSRGTAVLFNNSFEFEILGNICDNLGNFTLVEITLHNDLSIVLGSIYGPNQDNPVFITNLVGHLEDFNNPNILLGGDWNCTRNYGLDNINYVAHNNKRMSLAIDSMCNDLSLIDPWRINNPNSMQFTWLQGISNKQARLDYFLCNDELLSITKNYHINPKYRSDHAPISCNLNIGNNIKGPGTWKFNNSLLLDKNFATMIKKEINIFKSIYAATPYHPNYIESISTGFDLMISSSLFWETLLVTLRGAIIKFCKKRKTNKNNEILNLEKRIKYLDTTVTSGSASQADILLLAELNITLVALRKEILKGAYIRSRANWLEYGEKPNKFFLNLENKNRVNKNISEIKISEDETITNQSDILNCLKEFYEELYKKPNHNLQVPADPVLTPKTLTDHEKNLLEEPITKPELDTALKNMKNNKSPGLDGYSPEFFKFFWPQIGFFFLDCINECFANNNLTDSQTQGLITCIPKAGKARNLIKNWRPISLLNTTYKLISSCLTNRLRPLLCRIISQEQKGFLENRSISDCTRLMYDLIYECQFRKINGLILLIDFEKAFDSISWDYIRECLIRLNFGDNFLKWINIFQKDSKSRVILNGHMSDLFSLERGCRQGDPISPYLFIVCSEFLTQAIINNQNIEGITVLEKEHKASQYADDTSLFLKANEINLKHALQTLQWFYLKSGLKTNESKTKVIKIGPIRESDRRFCRENNLDWVTKFTALGISYDVMNIENITDANIDQKKEEIKKLMQSWSCRNITPMGRITVLKSLILSKIIHILQSLPTPSTCTLNEIDKLNFDFIWKKKRHEVSKTTLCLNWDKGGLDMINLKEFDMSLKLTWLRKYLKQSPEWSEFANFYNIDNIIWTGLNYHKSLVNIHNPFWRSVKLAFIKWYNTLDNCGLIEIEHQPIWGNINLNMPMNMDMLKNNIIFIKDLFDENGLPKTHHSLEQSIGKNLMFLTYHAIWRAIPKNWKDHMLLSTKNTDLQLPPIYNWLTKDKKGTKNIRKIWSLGKQETIPKGQEKWCTKLLNPHVIEWDKIYNIARMCKMNSRIVYFQYQVLHRSLITNKKLQQFGIRDNNVCDNCDEEETIIHLLINCPVAVTIWREISQWLHRTLNSEIHLETNDILLGNPKNETVTNCVILIVKHEIYKNKWNRTRLTLQKLKSVIKSHMDLDVYLGRSQGRPQKAIGKWSSLYNLL